MPAKLASVMLNQRAMPRSIRRSWNPSTANSPLAWAIDITHNQFSSNLLSTAHLLPVRQIVLLLATLIFGPERSSLALTQYTGDGSPTPLEEEIRWRVNRGRFDSASENHMRGTTYIDVSASSGPLSPHQSLAAACRHHSEDMAKNNLFQHATVPGSAYYNPVTQPNPWDRMVAEGYVWNRAGENIAAGYNGAEAAYVGWWNRTGHRVSMYDSGLREIGNGYFYWAGSTYGRYYKMDLGSDSSNSFFSDTVFRDLNGNGVYDAGEGVPGIVILLKSGSTNHNYFDISADVGSFAIPIQSLTVGANVR